MNGRHAAALVLLGWYLLLPPFGPNEKAANTGAPFAQWEHNGSFDSASACEDAQAKGRDFYRGDKREVERFVWGRCIASDDPRLKAK